MDNRNSWSCTFELEDIEIIDHKTENEDKLGKWHCDQCSLFFLEKGKLDEHKKKHSVHEIVKCKYCNKTISSSSVNRECYMNRKCETCEYKCSNCPQRFLRHSSLMNHEKKHSSPKKKRTINSYKKINGITAENIAVSKGLKKKQIKVGDLEEQDLEELKPKKTVNMKNSLKMKANLEVNAQTILDGEKTPIKKPRRLSLKACKSAEGKDNCEYLPVKTTKRLTLKNNKQLEENNSDAKSKQSTITFNTQTVSQTSNVSNSENVVNYKPFSCHVCGDTFASDSALLDHIRTHGENAAKSFKCKFCGDEFDDIYKMQYHLAICPLAEDELESSLKQVIPANIPTKCSGGTSSPRKRGRPKKMVESPLDREHYMNEPTPSLKRGNFRKRKSEDKESNETGQNPSGPSLPKQSKKSQNKKPLSGPDSIRVSEDSVTDYVPGDISEVTKESELDHEKKKLHQCPFPRCDFKFTREKALLCHMRNHSDDFDDSLKCHKCDIPFDDIHTLRLHINSCKGIKEERDDDFNRGDCYDSSPNRTFHRTKKDFVCNQCGRSYQNQEKLNRCTHENLQTTVCRICGVEAEDENSLKRHFNSTHPKSSPYQCPSCKAEFDSTLAEHDHRMTHVKKGEHFTCVICSTKFPTYKHLYFHYSKDHVEQSESICKICNITFKNQMALEEHNYVRHKSKDRFKCIFCHKVYSSSVYLTVHMKTHTTKIFKCKICYRPFTDMASLFQHMLFHASTLETERPLKCAVCLAAYAKQSAFKYHISGHITKDTSLFNCLVCGETLPDYESMCTHIFDHSIRITENKMTKKENEWVCRIKGGKSVMKRRRPRLSLNNDPDFKPNVNVGKDDPNHKSNIDIKSVNIESEETPALKRGRGRPRNIVIEETPGTKRERGRPRKKSEDRDATIEKTPSTKISDGVVQKYEQRNTRRSGRLGVENTMENFKVNKEMKKKKEDKALIKIPNQTLKIGDECSALKTKESFASSTSKSNLRINRLRGKKIHIDRDLPKKGSNKVNQDEGATPKVQASQIGSKVPHNHHALLIANTEVNGISETKVRPMSFKMFSSLTNTRAFKVVNKELRNDELAREEAPVKNSSFVNLDSLDVKEEMFDDEEDPLGGIEIPYVSERKGLRSSFRFLNGNQEPNNAEKETLSNQDESNQFNDSESRNSSGFIKEKKYFEPSRGLTKYSCTTCFLSFSTQEELLFHNTTHIL